MLQTKGNMQIDSIFIIALPLLRRPATRKYAGLALLLLIINRFLVMPDAVVSGKSPIEALLSFNFIWIDMCVDFGELQSSIVRVRKDSCGLLVNSHQRAVENYHKYIALVGEPPRHVLVHSAKMLRKIESVLPDVKVTTAKSYLLRRLFWNETE